MTVYTVEMIDYYKTEEGFISDGINRYVSHSRWFDNYAGALEYLSNEAPVGADIDGDKFRAEIRIKKTVQVTPF